MYNPLHYKVRRILRVGVQRFPEQNGSVDFQHLQCSTPGAEIMRNKYRTKGKYGERFNFAICRYIAKLNCRSLLLSENFTRMREHTYGVKCKMSEDHSVGVHNLRVKRNYV